MRRPPSRIQDAQLLPGQPKVVACSHGRKTCVGTFGKLTHEDSLPSVVMEDGWYFDQTDRIFRAIVPQFQDPEDQAETIYVRVIAYCSVCGMMNAIDPEQLWNQYLRRSDEDG